MSILRGNYAFVLVIEGGGFGELEKKTKPMLGNLVATAYFCRYTTNMAKTNPIGIRFTPDMISHFNDVHKIEGHQMMVNYLWTFYAQKSGLLKGVVKITNLTPEEKKTNFTVDTTTPKNLLQLKELCPHKEFGEERSAWIATERQKYNI